MLSYQFDLLDGLIKISDQGTSQLYLISEALLVDLKQNGKIRKCTDAKCSIFHLRQYLYGVITLEKKSKFNLETSRTTQMQLYKCIHVP
jgi:hypothetical protein